MAESRGELADGVTVCDQGASGRVAAVLHPGVPVVRHEILEHVQGQVGEVRDAVPVGMLEEHVVQELADEDQIPPVCRKLGNIPAVEHDIADRGHPDLICSSVSMIAMSGRATGLCSRL